MIRLTCRSYALKSIVFFVNSSEASLESSPHLLFLLSGDESARSTPPPFSGLGTSWESTAEF
jgi:hypothetical protein